MKPHSSSRLILLFKLTVTLALIAVIVNQIDWNKLKSVLQIADLLLIFGVVVLALVNITISALKWRILLSAHGIRVQLSRLTAYYFTGMFFSNFLPTSIGGDSYRVYMIYKDHGTKSAAIIPIIAERLTGLIALIWVGTVCSLISYLYDPNDELTYYSLFTSVVAFAGTLLMLVSIFNRFILKFFIKAKFLPSKIRNAIEKLETYEQNFKSINLCLLLSCGFYILLLSSRFVILLSVDAYCSIFNLGISVFISNIAGAIPISINGFGLVDGSFIYSVTHYGVVYEKAVAAMFLHRIISLSLSILGVVFYYRNPDKSMHEVKSISSY